MTRVGIVLVAATVACLSGTAGALAQNACEAARKACASETSGRSGPYYQLVEVTPHPNPVADGWKIGMQAGLITLDNPFGHSECAWEPAFVDRIYPEGVDIAIRSAARSTSGSSVGAFVQLVQGFGPNGDLGRNSFEARAQAGGSASDQAMLHIDPHLPNAFAKVGDRISIDVGGCEAGTVTYVYEYRE